ncbi:hypothetical protein LX97_00239 [Nonlabens dokdonensis]|jgi:uncharacterized membrane protein (UPF0127 family)|uniref:Secreted protein containing DUF192 n=2 Tax=Nonlabens dokdonensis TaxID=328515 RepID=L7W216_NONDD|nr:DUF192 domain-containing protein [Nonlabens dokdonensis]AGC75545.1 secreted protein containing DUF192 [Nonlabens dokdonensis DSW-6]PZX43239.1 hypothetical protein LX97_00239 [Nonlabens dokdonensis]
MRNLITGLFVATIIASSCKPNFEEEMKSKDFSFQNEATGYFITKEKDTLKKLQLELADTDYKVQLGMTYKEELTEDQGLLFVFDRSDPRQFYMKNTNVPLDIIFVDENYIIDSFVSNAQPNDTTISKSKKPVQYVLDLKAGMATKLGLQEGDTFIWE